MNRLVTVRTFSSCTDFEIVKSYLESCGIECFGRDEITNRAYLANIDGGIKLQVKSDSVEEAVKFLLEKGYLIAADFEPSPVMKWINEVLNLSVRKRKNRWQNNK